MISFTCDECRAISLELREAHASRERRPHQDVTREELVAWLQRLYEDDCAQMRETSNLWKTWRRLQKHRALTGHWVPLLGAPPDTESGRN